ncbi:galectin-4-like [Pristis pectinata]|uniref:galectin-4-like n=1 Tax=Pristis pectinata TaxID=685728 RepID=UPI00223E79DB|nr:galectin-4-like [Pristis pectinata]
MYGLDQSNNNQVQWYRTYKFKCVAIASYSRAGCSRKEKEGRKVQPTMEFILKMVDLEIKAGGSLEIEGVIKHSADRFSFNLGKDDNNLALHFNPRFDEGDGVLVTNNRVNGVWQTEQKDFNFPFKKGEEFKLVIKFLGEKFEIVLPDYSKVAFPNRTDMDALTLFLVQGHINVKLLKLNFDPFGERKLCSNQKGHDRYYNKYINVKRGGIGGVAMLLAGYVIVSYIWEYDHLTSYSRAGFSCKEKEGRKVQPTMEFILKMVDLEIKAGGSLEIEGVIKHSADRFSFNLGKDDNNLALHFNPRFDEGDGVLVTNNRVNGVWQTEQRDFNFPFKKGEKFQLVIKFLGEKFEIVLPDCSKVIFPNRSNMDMFTYFLVQGQINVKLLKLNF